MDFPPPFILPEVPPGRKHGPGGYADYQSYKDWLRDEFEFRCVYCLQREKWYPSGHAAFAVEHIVPQRKRPDLICDYENLAYACSRCNSLKQELETLDPTRVALGKHLGLAPDGSVHARSDEGRELIDLFQLNTASVLNVRKEKLGVLQLKHEFPNHPEVDKLFRTMFGYPEDLPDLRPPAKRPKRNSRP